LNPRADKNQLIAQNDYGGLCHQKQKTILALMNRQEDSKMKINEPIRRLMMLMGRHDAADGIPPRYTFTPYLVGYGEQYAKEPEIDTLQHDEQKAPNCLDYLNGMPAFQNHEN
jgi:hypothetical protein